MHGKLIHNKLNYNQIISYHAADDFNSLSEDNNNIKFYLF